MKKRILSMLLAALLCLALLPAGLLTGAALAAEEPDYTSEEVTEDSFERVMDLAYRLRDENSQPGTGGGFTWDSEGKKRKLDLLQRHHDGRVPDAGQREL